MSCDTFHFFDLMDFDIFRCIPQEQRSFGLGIQWIIARCLGNKSYYYHVFSGVSLESGDVLSMCFMP